MAITETLNLAVSGDIKKQIAQINANLKKVIEAEEDAALKGLASVTTFIQGESQEITPHAMGVLVGSSFSSVGEDNGHLVGRVGYTADYAPYVHEMPDPTNSGKPVNWSKKGTGNKFLEKAVKNNIDFILKELKEFLTIK